MPTVSTVILSITPVEFTVALAKAPVPSPSMKILVLGEKRVTLAARLLVTAALLILTLLLPLWTSVIIVSAAMPLPVIDILAESTFEATERLVCVRYQVCKVSIVSPFAKAPKGTFVRSRYRVPPLFKTIVVNSPSLTPTLFKLKLP